MVFLSFPTLSAPGRWLGGWIGRAGERCPLEFSYGFPTVFLWFSYTFSSGSVAWRLDWARRTKVPGRVLLWFSDGFPMVFLHFQLWVGGLEARLDEPDKGARSSVPMVFLWFSSDFPTLSALGRWLGG